MLGILSRICVLASAILFATQFTNAASITIDSSSIDNNEYGERCLVARIAFVGDIVQGDADRLKKTIKRITEDAAAKNSTCYVNDGVDQRLIYVSMQSPGGLYSEGWKIAKILGASDSVAATYVDEGSYCYSACAVAFLGGSVPGAEGAVLMKRVIHPRAKLGFHAPFPHLIKQSYTSQEIMAFFLSAFSVSHQFVLDAKSLGIEPEVAQLLLQPTPDRFFEIDSVGRVLLTRTTVSQGEFSFSIYGKVLKKLSRDNIINLCYNNAILKERGDTTALADFFNHENVKSIVSVKTTTSYFSSDNIFAEALIVPVSDAGEGNVLSCVAVTATVANEETKDNEIKFSCLGFEFGSESLQAKIAQMGTDWIWRDNAELGCVLPSTLLALAPWSSRLVDVPEFLLDE